MGTLLTIIVVLTIGYFVLRRTKKPTRQLPVEELLDPDTREFVENRKRLEQPYSYFIDSSREPPRLLAALREKHKNQSLATLTELYYSLLTKIQEERRNRDFKKMSMYSQMSLGLIEPLILQTQIEYGSFDLGSIPALEEPLPYYAIHGNVGQIRNIEEMIAFFQELSGWQEMVRNAKEMARMSVLLMTAIEGTPGVLQKDIKKLVGVDDGKKVANVLHYMELYNKIHKEKSGNTNKLFATGCP
jgi:hypothetical protein